MLRLPATARYRSRRKALVLKSSALTPEQRTLRGEQ